MKQTKEQKEREEKLFFPYESILQARKEALIELPLDQFTEDTTVFVTEKLHGVNVSIILDFEHKGILLGKRNSLVSMLIPLEDNPPKLQDFFTESFFTNNFVFAVTNLWSKIKAIWELLRTENPVVKTAHLFGELFGGCYEGEQDKRWKSIQTEVKYCPEPLIYLFQIFIDGKSVQAEEFFKITEKVDFPKAPLLFTKPLKEVIDLKNKEVLMEYKEFETTIPARLNLSKLDNNFAEGIVLSFGDIKLKLKSDKFFEVANAPKEKPKKQQKTPQDPFQDRLTPARI